MNSSIEARHGRAAGDPRGPTVLSITAMHAAYLAGELDPLEVIEAAIDNGAVAAGLSGWVTATPERARQAARRARDVVRQARRGDHVLPPLTGVPVSVKDVFPMAGVVTTHGSASTRARPSTRDGALVNRLVQACAAIVGTTSLAEFGQSATTEHRLGPPAANPWRPELTVGGSSGGAAVTVVTGAAVAAVGTDGGGSVRIPAAFAGLTGFKPTQGWGHDPDGLQAMTPFSTPGPLAHRAGDARIMAQVLQQADLRPEVPRRLRLGRCGQPSGVPIDPPQRDAVTTAADVLAGDHEVVDIDLDMHGWMAAFGPQVVAEEHQRRGRLLAEADLLTDYELAALRAGAKVTPEQLVAACDHHRQWRGWFLDQLDGLDAILLPATATGPFPHGTRPTTIDGQSVNPTWGAFATTACFNVAGMPAGVTRTGWHDDLPVAVQVAARPGRDALVLDLLDQLEAGLPTHTTQRWPSPPTTPAQEDH